MYQCHFGANTSLMNKKKTSQIRMPVYNFYSNLELSTITYQKLAVD